MYVGDQVTIYWYTNSQQTHYQLCHYDCEPLLKYIADRGGSLDETSYLLDMEPSVQVGWKGLSMLHSVSDTCNTYKITTKSSQIKIELTKHWCCEIDARWHLKLLSLNFMMKKWILCVVNEDVDVLMMYQCCIALNVYIQSK